MYENRYNKQLQEAFEAGYRKALNEQGAPSDDPNYGPNYWNTPPCDTCYWVKDVGWVLPGDPPIAMWPEVTYPGKDDPIWGGENFQPQTGKNFNKPLPPVPYRLDQDPRRRN